MILCSLALPAAAEVGTAKIMAPWEANGQIFQVAVDKLQFIGTFEGIMYIEHGDGLLDTAIFTCPSTQIIYVLNNTISAQGYCAIESPSGDYVFAEYACEGQPGVCKGTFTLTGGTGKLTGITGQSQMVVRTALSGTSKDEVTGGTVSAAKGLAVWPEMRFEVPGLSARAGLFGAAPAASTDGSGAPAGEGAAPGGDGAQ
ncbi:hypothetical protein [Caldichromatium japonicum]|uniref:hypothetical protein n=1 Tax=Caldichromatium japonicum TaxID=2699430 RepID=UPI001FE4BBC1|nr:hypothetical protein [Caldichromatium japonicum]